MEELINQIDIAVNDLVKADMISYAEHAQKMVDMMVEVFPQIIMFYSDSRMSDFTQDAKYWPMQLERIVEALSRGDDYYTIDVLANETKANLKELMNILRMRGIEK